MSFLGGVREQTLARYTVVVGKGNGEVTALCSGVATNLQTALIANFVVSRQRTTLMTKLSDHGILASPPCPRASILQLSSLILFAAYIVKRVKQKVCTYVRLSPKTKKTMTQVIAQ